MDILNLGKSKITKDLLTLYFSQPEKQYYIRELERKFKLPAAYIRRELMRLEKDGLFASKYLGKERFFYLNRDFYLYEEIKSIIAKSTGLLGAMRERLLAAGGVSGVIVVEDEDIMSLKMLKLLVVSSGLSEEARQELVSLGLKENRQIEITVYSPEAWTKGEADNEPWFIELAKTKESQPDLSMQSYKKLFTYWYALIIYDWTVLFCNQWIASYKQKEQMTGAARSGKQNIVEGSDGMATSLKTGIKLSGVAKHSLEELLNDYEDFLRQRGLRQWNKGEKMAEESRKRIAKFVYELAGLKDEAAAIRKIKSVPFPQNREMAANLLITLCHQATYLLFKQVEALKKKHAREGGLTEELYRKRRAYRGF